MTRSLRAALTLFAALGLAGAASTAQAQCPSGATFCADLSVSGNVVMPTPRGAQVIITVGPVRPPPPPQIVVVRPPPPPVVVVRPPPPPPVVIVRPPPPPPPQYVVVRPPPPQVVYQQQPVYYQQPQYQQYRAAPRNVSGTVGLHFFFAGAGGGSARLGGMGAAIRIRPKEHFALDLGAGVYGGTDHNGNSRVEIPLTVDALYFVNPQNRAQFYLVGGVGASFAYSDYKSTGILTRSFTYVGGNAGAGVEFRLTRGFALNFDFRGVLRGQPHGAPEFSRVSDGLVQTTRTSAGVVGQLGATLYF